MSSSVIAASDIPEGTCSLPGVGEIDLRCLLEKTTSKVYYHVHVLDGHLSIMNMHDRENWSSLIAVAKNCHEQNVELKKNQEGLILRTTRPIKALDELFVWIGSDLLLLLDYPFLKPVNIKGNQTYFCHRCGKVFQNPNPLKVHLSFQCLTSKTKFSPESSKSDSQLDTKSAVIEQYSTEDIKNLDRMTLNNTMPQFLQLIGKKTSFDIFTQMKTLQREESPNSKCFDYSFEYNISGKTSASTFMKAGSGSRTSSGYVCGYCGKVYSRKYGLKIHVRTHTGYKPLKCKFCFRPFSDPSNLNKHVRLHSEADTPYRCPICGKVLVRRRDLQRHIKSRHQGTELSDG